CGWTQEQVRTWLIDSGRQWKLERGQMSEEECRRSLEADSGCDIDPDRLKHAAADIFRLNDSIVPVVRQLKESGIRLVLLSNTSVTHLNFIRSRWDILEYMDAHIASCDVGALKPEAAIYEAALKVSGCDPEECFYTDDIPAYIEKAREFGIHAHVYRDTPGLVEALRSVGVG
ncbi:MAG: HAD family phosphatase, partial [Planctomycetaceae bacterium]|nr:HAD family phosphatase [Planctomycetaceae bacterium]